MSRGYMLRSARGDWRTPASVVDVAREALGGHIALDPCAGADSAIGAMNDRGPHAGGFDGLAHDWCVSAFVNPPFGDLAAWARKCAREGARGTEVVLLLPARTDTAYWHDSVSSAALVCFWRGRLRFVGAPAACPFPVAFAYWGKRPALFHAAFAPHGMVVAPSRSGGAGRSAEGEG